MCLINKKIKQLALTKSPQELMTQYKQLDSTLKYFYFSGNEDKVLTTLKEQHKLKKTMIFQYSKKYNRIIKRRKKEKK